MYSRRPARLALAMLPAVILALAILAPSFLMAQDGTSLSSSPFLSNTFGGGTVSISAATQTYNPEGPTFTSWLPAVATNDPLELIDVGYTDPDGIGSYGTANAPRMWYDGTELTKCYAVGVQFYSSRITWDHTTVTQWGSGCNTLNAEILPMTDGTHTVKVIAKDNLGNANTLEWSFTIDHTPPTITPAAICGTLQTTASPTISIGYNDALGVNSASVRMYLDGTVVPAIASASEAVYTPGGLPDGVHTIGLKLQDNGGNPASPYSCSFTVDTQPPVIISVSPADGETVSSSSAVIGVYWSDAGAGVDQYSAHIELDDVDVSASASVYQYNATYQATGLSLGQHKVSASVKDKTGKTSDTRIWHFRYAAPNYYHFTWYDNIDAMNWVLMGNPVGAPEELNFGLEIGGKSQSLGPFALKGAGCPGSQCSAGQVPGGMTITPIIPGLKGGPVRVNSISGRDAIVSQRSLWKGGNSLEEVPGTEDDKLSGHFYWSWYDNKSPGMLNWVLIANTNAAQDVYYEISIAGRVPAQSETVDGSPTGVIKPGKNVTPRFPNMRGGPVEVRAWTDSGRGTPAMVMASQRVLTNVGTAQEAFNEVPGIPESELSNDYLWTWYDNVSPGAINWVLVANTNAAQDVYYEISIGGRVPTQAETVDGSPTGVLKPGKNVTPRFPTLKGGPVEVKAWTDSTRTTTANVLASQRSLWGPSFEEVPGYGRTALSSDYHWTWYDQKDAGTYNWVLIANPQSAGDSASYDVYYEISVGGNVPTVAETTDGTPTGVIKPGKNVTPRFKALRGGPVEIKAWKADSSGNPIKSEPADIMASQRVLWHGYFNEVLGSLLE